MTIIEASSVKVGTMADGTLRITLDIEPRFAKDAFGLFGSPGTPVALAALKTAAQQQQPEKPKGAELAKLAGQWCQRDDFAYFLRPIYDKFMGYDGTGWGDVSPADFGGSLSTYARHCVISLCRVDSRAELDHNPEAAADFHRLIREPFSNALRKGIRFSAPEHAAEAA